MLTFGSLFAGIGGIDLGLERAGMTCRWQVENDPYALRVLAKHWPDIRRHSDIRTFHPDGGDWSVDLIAGGFPCQDISIAGKGIGIEGSRSGLWFEFARVVRHLRPRYVLVENVAALLIRGMDRVLGELAEIGYDAEWDCLPAAAFGAPHERDRLFLIAYPREIPPRCRIFADFKDDLPRNEQWRTSKGVRSGRGWKRWLVQACAVVDWHDPDRWFRRVDDGIPEELDAIGAYGNAVVPQVAEWIGRRIIEATC